jgi:ABC-type lipoprotein release transport system permease subunit
MKGLIHMPLMYPIKRVFRNWKLFTALLIGIALASTFFACIDVKANLAAQQSLAQQLKNVNVDMEFSANLNMTDVNQAQSNVSSIDGVKSVDVVYRFNEPIKDLTNNYTAYPQIASFPENSLIYTDWANKPADGIGENQTWILVGTTLASQVAVGNNITTQMMFPTPKQDNFTTVYMNLTVAGFAELTDTGYSLISGNYFFIPQYSPAGSQQIYNYRQDLMIVSWNNTLQKIWSTMQNRTVDTTFLITVDHDKLISPWNSQASIANVNTVASEIQNNVLSNYQIDGFVNNNLDNALSTFSSNFQSTLTQFIVFSIPVFFVSWYLGSTLSDVSFNMRRREIGLLSTKGLSSGQIQRMFFVEALTIGCIGGAIGVVGALALNQVFTGSFNLNTLFSPQAISPYTMVFTVVFGMVLALLSVFFSARKASKLPIPAYGCKPIVSKEASVGSSYSWNLQNYNITFRRKHIFTNIQHKLLWRILPLNYSWTLSHP